MTVASSISAISLSRPPHRSRECRWRWFGLPACSHGLVNMLVEPTFVAPLLTWPPLVLEFVLVHR